MVRKYPPHPLVAVAVVFGVLAFGLITGQLLGRIVLFTPGGVNRFSIDLQPVIEPIVMNVTMFSMMFVGMW